MEQRVARLESRLDKLEKELLELRKAAGLSTDAVKRTPLTGDQETFLNACQNAGADRSKVKIAALREDLGWEAKDFDNVLDGLSKAGRVILHLGSMGLSLSRMDAIFMGDNGESYTELSLP